MSKYLTLQQYKNFDDYPVSGIPDMTINNMITRAESDIDSYMGFDLRLGGFEPHNAFVQAPLDEMRMRTWIPNKPVPIRRALRYRIQVSNLSTSGDGFYATIDNNDVAYNSFDDYVEVVPLQSVTYSLAPVLIQLGLRPPIVQMDYEAGYFFGIVAETLIDSGDSTTYFASRGFWATSYTQALTLQPVTLPPVPSVIYVNGVVTTTGFTLNLTDGSVTFAVKRASTDVISADYTCQIPDNVRDATVLQTTYLLGQRALNQLGMQGVDFVRNDTQQIKRHPNVDLTQNGALCSGASSKLSTYVSIGIA